MARHDDEELAELVQRRLKRLRGIRRIYRAAEKRQKEREAQERKTWRPALVVPSMAAESADVPFRALFEYMSLGSVFAGLLVGLTPEEQRACLAVVEERTEDAQGGDDAG